MTSITLIGDNSKGHSRGEYLGLKAKSSVTVDVTPKTEGNCLHGCFYSQYESMHLVNNNIKSCSTLTWMLLT